MQYIVVTSAHAAMISQRWRRPAGAEIARQYTRTLIKALRSISVVRQGSHARRALSSALPKVVGNRGLNGFLVRGKAQVNEKLIQLRDVGDVVEASLEDRHQSRSLRLRERQASTA